MSLLAEPGAFRQRLGRLGESAAERELRRAGMVILERRCRMAVGEIDLVARRGPVVAFIEVKTRAGSGFGRPVEAVTWSKRREIVRVARAWIDRNGQPSDLYRFDVVGVDLTATGAGRIEHVEDAFRPGWR